MRIINCSKAGEQANNRKMWCSPADRTGGLRINDTVALNDLEPKAGSLKLRFTT